MNKFPHSFQAPKATRPPWKVHSGHLAWPTLVLFTLTLTAYGWVLYQSFLGEIPLWAGFLLNTFLGFWIFTPLHDAVHGSVGGHPKREGLDEFVGQVSGFLLWAPYPAFKYLHLQHHAHTNEGEIDPDYWVAGKSLSGVFLRCLTILPHYYHLFLFKFKRKSLAQERNWRMALFVLLFMIILAVLSVFTGHFPVILCLWILPAITATAILAFLFDWVPHYPHQDTDRLANSSVIIFPGLSLLMSWQNYHLIHHLYPRVPSYRYGTVFWKMRKDLEQKKAPIFNLRAWILNVIRQ